MPFRQILIVQILLLALVATAAAKPKSYTSGRLENVSMEDASFPFTLDKMTIPVSFGTMYKFDIVSEGVKYTAACFARKERGFASDWTVQDTIQFRIQDDKLFLKRSNGKELRVLVLTKTHDTNNSASPDLHPSRRTIPECR